MIKELLPIVVVILIIGLVVILPTQYLGDLDRLDRLECDMERILKITDGNITIDLLNTGNGIDITNPNDGWTPQTPAVSPTYQQSPLTDGASLSNYKLDNATETFNYNVEHNNQDELIKLVQDARRLLIKGINYHTVDWQDSVVYLVAKAKCETNTRYSVVKMVQFGEDANPYIDPFISPGNNPISNNGPFCC